MQSRMITKQDLIAALCAEITKQEQLIGAAAAAAKEAATHEEMKPENDKDTRALEASYLAGAQAARARELKAIRIALSFLPLKSFAGGVAIDISARVTLEAAGRRTHCFVAPHGGGMKVENAGSLITVVTPEAPLGRAMMGLSEGETFQMAGKTYEVVSVE
jgi:transcription elongation GreA/GreB family factor